MTKIIKIIVILFLSNNLFAKEPNKWVDLMDSFIAPLQKIYSVDMNQLKFSNKDKKVLSEGITEMQQATHKAKLADISFFSKSDPSVQANYISLLENLELAKKNIESFPKRSTYYLKIATHQCASCHSKGGESTQFFKLFKKTKLPLNEKAKLALALRDFSAASNIYESLLTTKNNPKDFFSFNRYLIGYINASLLMNTKNQDLINFIKKSKKQVKNPIALKEFKSLEKNIPEFKQPQNINKASNIWNEIPREYNLIQPYMFSILSLKNFFHKNLKDIKNNKLRAKTYRALGEIYEFFIEISSFMTPERYYELCIKELPHSDLSLSCFEHYKKSITLGYSGSMGIHIPQQEQVKMKKLKKLALK